MAIAGNPHNRANHQAVMAGRSTSNHRYAAGGNPKPGYGTMLTSDVANAATQPTPGFDAYTSPGPSIKVYNSLTNGYVAHQVQRYKFIIRKDILFW